jgi:hypothetical protein
MDKVGQLIEKLLADYKNQLSADQLMVTLQLLQKELLMHTTRHDHKAGSRRVAVVMPSISQPSFFDPVEQPVQETAGNEPAKEMLVLTEVPVPEQATAEAPAITPQPKPEPVTAPEAKELNDVIGINGTSLNEKLAEEKTAIAETLTETPLRDLKKGIGVNERYLFLSELFRGDESMYERSLKTINGFNILPEAQYWIERELKIKLGWNDSHPTVQQFYTLVKRRFS